MPDTPRGSAATDSAPARWEQRVARDPALRPGPRNAVQADVLRRLEETTARIRLEQRRQSILIDEAVAAGAPRAAVAAAADLSYDQFRMRQARGQALS